MKWLWPLIALIGCAQQVPPPQPLETIRDSTIHFRPPVGHKVIPPLPPEKPNQVPVDLLNNLDESVKDLKQKSDPDIIKQ